MNTPKLRFKTDDGTEYPAWSKHTLGELVLIQRGGSPRPIEAYMTTGEGINWIKIGDAPIQGNRITSVKERIVPDGASKSRRVCRGDLLLSNSMSFGRSYILEVDGCIHDGWLLIRDENSIFDSMFLCEFLGTDAVFRQYKRLAAGSTVNNLNKDLVSGVTVYVPDKQEQRKIAALLSSVDDVITAQAAEVAAWEEHKKGVMQKLFSQEVRFKADDGAEYPAWEEKTLGEVFTEIKEKNHPELPVLSVQQGVGTVLRDSSERRITYDKNNLKSYKAMKKGDFIIHLRSFEGGLECSNYDGISSPAYRILRPNMLLSDAFRDYFRSYAFIEGKLSESVVGIRDGKNIDMPTFWEIQIAVPSLPEQRKIAECLSSLDEVIAKAKDELVKWQELKKGLLQQMFV